MAKRRDFTTREKADLLKCYDTLPPMSVRQAARELKISHPCLAKLLKNRTDIELGAILNDNQTRRRRRKGKEEDVEKALKQWVLEVQEKNVILNGPMLRQKAELLAREMGKTEFKATDGWLSRWRKRENISFMKLQNNASDAGQHIVIHCDLPFIESITEDEMCSIFKPSEPAESIGPHTESTESIEINDLNEQSSSSPPTVREMIEALSILSKGIRSKTSDLQPLHDFERYVEKVLDEEEIVQPE